MREEVERRARETFQRLRIRGTRNATGILIYVSLHEQMVHVVGDDAINTKLSQDDWEALTGIIISGFKDGKPMEGMRTASCAAGSFWPGIFPLNRATGTN